MGFCCGSSNMRVKAEKVAKDLPLGVMDDDEKEALGEALIAFYEKMPFAYTHLNYYGK